MGLGIVLATRTVLAIAGICTLFVCVGSRWEQTPEKAHFRWDWKDLQELSATQSLRGAKLTIQQRKAIVSAIADQIRPMMSEPGIVRTTTTSEIKSDAELRDAVLDTRATLIDLNGDGVPEVVAQGMVNCGATGNCPFWIFRKAKHAYELLLDGEAQTFTIQKSNTNGFHDIVLSDHGSSTSGGLRLYKYKGNAYVEVGCYTYDWTLEDDKVRELKEPRVTPCGVSK